MKLAKRLNDNLEFIRDKLGEGVSFDVLIREIKVGGKDAALVFLDGLAKDHVTTDIIRAMIQVDRAEIQPNTIDKMLGSVIPFMEISVVETLDETIDQVLSGQIAVLID